MINLAEAQVASESVVAVRKGRRLLRLHLFNNATDNTRPLKVMPAAKVGVATFEIPENAVRVLLTGYGVSPDALHYSIAASTRYCSYSSPPQG